MLQRSQGHTRMAGAPTKIRAGIQPESQNVEIHVELPQLVSELPLALPKRPLHPLVSPCTDDASTIGA